MGHVALAGALVLSVVRPVEYQIRLSSILTQLSGDEFKECQIILISTAPDSIRQFDHLVRATNTSGMHLARLYGVIALSKIDRKPFLPHAVQHLTHDDVRVRMAAAGFVGNVGSATDSGPLLVLLSDPKIDVAYAAARALGSIGDSRVSTSLSVWLNVVGRPGDDPTDPFSLSRAVTKARDQIDARLAVAKPAASR